MVSLRIQKRPQDVTIQLQGEGHSSEVGPQDVEYVDEFERVTSLIVGYVIGKSPG